MCHALKWLVRHRCKTKRRQKTKTNIANVKSLLNPLTLLINAILEMYKLEKQNTRRVLADSAYMGAEYLNAKLQVVIDVEKDEDITRLEMLITNKCQRKIWLGIRYVTSPYQSGGVRKVIIPKKEEDD